MKYTKGNVYGFLYETLSLIAQNTYFVVTWNPNLGIYGVFFCYKLGTRWK